MKCLNCGLVNFKTETTCKRCGELLMSAAPPVSDESVHSSQGVWRDATSLVLGEQFLLPERCMKCNSADGVTFETMKIDYLPAYNVIFLLVGFLLYREFNLPVGLCTQHRASKWKKNLIACSLMIFGGIAFVTGFNSYTNFIMGLGVLMFFGGLISLAIGSRSPVSIKKFDKQNSHLWVTGVNQNYLAALPQWTGR